MTSKDSYSMPGSGISASRLALLMFFQLFSQGAFNPVLSMYLKDFLHFSGAETGAILAGAVITALLAPLFALYIIDRLVPARSLLVICHSAMVVLALVLGRVTDFGTFMVLYILYMAQAGPTVGLVNAVAFQHVKGGSRAFGGLRLWGTLGWIGAGWLVSLVWMFLPPGQMKDWYPLIWVIAAAGSVVTITSALALPVQPRVKAEKTQFIPPETRDIFRKPEIIILCLVYLLSSILDRFYSFGTAPYFLDLGIARNWVMPVMTLGQISEVFTLLTLAWMVRRFDFRRLMLAGMVVQLLRFALYAAGSLPLALVGVSLNGFIFAWLYTCITMYIDSHTGQKERAGVHQILVFVFSGISSLLGNISAGFLNDHSPAGSMEGWRLYWLVPVAGAVLVLVILLAFFIASGRRDRARKET